MTEAPLRLLYCPYPTLDAAREAATALLEARLVACCNLLAISESLYWWEGKLAANPETLLLAKTAPAQEAAVRAWIAHHHPYDTPAILSLDASANPAFAAWVGVAVAPQ
jgi:periplasmic divalent cation tolerance protein